MSPAALLGARFSRLVDQTAVLACLITVLAGLAVAWVAVANPGAYRLALAGLIGANLLLISLRWPRGAAIATLAGLPFLALMRRLLIGDAGWTSQDPLLLVAPLVAMALVYRFFAVEHRPLRTDRLSKLVLALLAVTLLQTFNPTGAGLSVNVVGLLFAAVPLLWFFVGRELADERLVMGLGTWMIASAALIALYGLRQTNVGLLPWDQQWVEVAGYASLKVGSVTRAFGTFSSGAEYAQYLASALMVAASFALYRRRWPLLLVPLLAVAIFLSSIRTTLILAAVAIIVVVILRTVKRPQVAAAASITVILLGVGVMQVLSSKLQGDARQSQSDLVQHQLGGVADPLNSNQSTLAIHSDLIAKGMVKSIHHPLGQGVGITTQAANTLKANSSSTELDLSDTFVSLGLFGGVLYLVVIWTAFSRTVGLYYRQRAAAPLVVLGVLMVGFGQWLNGGRYATSAIIWFFLGWVASQYAGPGEEESNA